MSNQIDLIYAKQVETQLKNVKAELVSTYAEMVKISNLKIDFFGGKAPTNQSGLKNTIADYGAVQEASKKVTEQLAQEIKKRQELEGQVNRLKSSLNQLANSQNSTNTAGKRGASVSREQSIAQQILRTETDRNFRATTLLGGAYARASAQLLILKRNAKDAAIAYGENSRQAKEAAAAAAALDSRIKSADAAVGDYQRNVGNYSGAVVSGFQKVFSVVRQLAYILPGIGIAGIFSMALEPLYKLIEGTGILSDNMLEIRKNTEAYHNALLGIKADSREANDSLEALVKTATNSLISDKERSLAVEELRNKYQRFFAGYTDGQIKAGKFGDALEKINTSLRAQAEIQNLDRFKKTTDERILAIQDELKERAKFAEQERYFQNIIKQNTVIVNAGTKGAQNGLTAEGKLATANLATLRRSNSERKKTLEEKNEETLLYKTDKELLKDIERLERRRAKAQSDIVDATGKALLLGKDDKKGSGGRKIDTTPNVEALNAEGAAADSLLEDLERLIKVTEQYRQVLSKDSIEYDKYTKQIENLRGAIKLITEPPKGDMGVAQLKKVGEQIEANEKRMIALVAETNAFIRSISQDFISQSSLPSLVTFFDGTFDRLIAGAETFEAKFAVTFNAIANVAKDVFAYINKLGEQDYENASNRLEKQYQISLKYAGDSATARTEIDRKYEAERRQLARARAKAEKEAAIFNTIINTAAAVVAALANPGGPAGVVLAALVGILGAAQVAVIASEPLPQFKDGGVHKGGLMMVNDAKGSKYQEKIVTPDGKIYSPKGRNVLMNAPSGTEIFTPDQWDKKTVFPAELNYGALPRDTAKGSDFDYDRIGKEMRGAVKDLPILNLNIDKDGFAVSQQRGLAKTNYINNRIAVRGKSV